MGKFRRESDKLPPDLSLQRRLVLALDEASTQERLYDRSRQEVELQGLSPAEYALLQAWLVGRQTGDGALMSCLSCGRVQMAETGCPRCRERITEDKDVSAQCDAPLH